MGIEGKGRDAGVGIPLLFLLHVLDLVAHFPLYFHGSGIALMVVYLIGVSGVAMPFIIWFVFFFLEKEPALKNLRYVLLLSAPGLPVSFGICPKEKRKTENFIYPLLQM